MEKNKETIVAEATKNVRATMWISLIFGGIFLLLSIFVEVKEIDFSNTEIETAKTWYRIDSSERNLYPSEGIDYQLEARVVKGTTDTEELDPAAWYREFIAAEYGDTIEVRLKATAARATDLDVEDIRQRMFFRSSSGLELLTAASEHEQLVLPDGSRADYLDGASDERIAYITVGTFKFTSSDWWKGRSASAIVPTNTDMFTKLEVIAPYCEVYLPLLVVLVIANVAFLIILPTHFSRKIKRIREHPEELEDLDTAE